MEDIKHIDNFYDFKFKKTLNEMSQIKNSIILKLKVKNEKEDVDNITKR